MDFYALSQQCASSHFQEREVVAAIAKTESTFNPFAIGVVNGSVKQPRSLPEAINTVRFLLKNGYNFSVGLMQVNKTNFNKYGLNESNMFDPCTNLKAGISIFKNCYDTAHNRFGGKYSYDGKLRLAASCYYSGNFKTGFVPDFKGQPSYVTKFYNNLTGYRGRSYQQPTVVPTAIAPITTPQTQADSEAMVAVSSVQKPSERIKTPYDDLLAMVEEQKRAIKAKAGLKTEAQPEVAKTEAQPPTYDLLATNITKNHKWDIFQDF